MEPSPELQQRVQDLYRAMSGMGADAVEAFYSLAEGSVFIGTDAEEYWTDSRQHNADVRPFFDGSVDTYTWKPRNVLALREGAVGWTVDRPVVITPEGAELPARVTLVWCLEDDNVWRVVHSHASVGGQPSEG